MAETCKIGIKLASQGTDLEHFLRNLLDCIEISSVDIKAKMNIR